MPIISSRVTVLDSPTLLLNPSRGGVADPITATLRNAGGVAVFLGGESVASASGYELAPGGTLSVDLIAGDLLYAITAAMTSEVHVMKFRQ